MNATQTPTEEYISYHLDSLAAGDVDPAYGALRYVADRFELNEEQKYWLAILYSASYCGATAFLMYNEFPDYERVDFNRMDDWWEKARPGLLFQTDRKWLRSRNQFVNMMRSYRNWVGKNSQYIRFQELKGRDPQETYRRVYEACTGIYQMGRFGAFIYTEAVATITGYPMRPDRLDLAEAESCRNGLCYALGRTDWITGKETGKAQLGAKQVALLNKELVRLAEEIIRRDESGRSNIWNIETTLCAFKKYKRTQLYPDTPKQHRRYVGYYLDRQADEIRKMQHAFKNGVCWEVLWQYRKEKLNRKYLSEYK